MIDLTQPLFRREPTTIEGYWRSEQEPDLPLPVQQSEPVFADFIRLLIEVQKVARVDHYKGWSTCRICGIHNGSAEYEFGGYRWPSGLEHYLTHHNVHPSAAFMRMILEKTGWIA